MRVTVYRTFGLLAAITGTWSAVELALRIATGDTPHGAAILAVCAWASLAACVVRARSLAS